MCGCFWSLFFVSLVYLSVLVPIRHHPNYCNFMKKSWYLVMKVLQLLLFFSSTLSNLGLLHFLINFNISFSVSTKTKFDWACTCLSIYFGFTFAQCVVVFMSRFCTSVLDFFPGYLMFIDVILNYIGFWEVFLFVSRWYLEIWFFFFVHWSCIQ